MMATMRTQLHHLLEQAAEPHAAPALAYRDESASYGRLWGTVRAGAVGLRSLGLLQNDRLAIYLDKRIETVEAIFAISAAAGSSSRSTTCSGCRRWPISSATAGRGS
jgi:acyl-CoA synthetase (AMP-forming)/AMP-acid ligase II